MLTGLLLAALLVFVEHLYLLVSRQANPQTPQQHASLARGLEAVEFSVLPSNAAARGRAKHLVAANQYDLAAEVQRSVLTGSVATARDWYDWLGVALFAGAPQTPDRDIDRVVSLLDDLAKSDPTIRLGLSRMGLKAWYRVSPKTRSAFRKHLDWMVNYNSKMLWGHAYLVKRELLLCRIYSDDGIELPLCQQ